MNDLFILLRGDDVTNVFTITMNAVIIRKFRISNRNAAYMGPSSVVYYK